MGVPGFFLWLTKNYKGSNFIFSKSKLLNIIEKQEIKTLYNQVSNLDYLLIDANCLIHPVCFKVLADYPKLKDKDKLEYKMIVATFEYIEKIINYVQPKKGVYLAIDGVAPVAKIKQQRYRRFKSVNDRELQNNIRKKYKKEIPYFWNNSAITPGTPFMKKLHTRINEWAKKFGKTNKLDIIYSSCNVPSEGEHKLLQFIRNNQKQNINNTYVMYGLDADLIFLVLSTGIEDIFLLREAHQINKKDKTDDLNFVSIRKMRECIYDTIHSYIVSNEYFEEEELLLDKKRIIDDFIFICYLMGNDFLPHLPSIDIYDGGIDYLINKYSYIYLEHQDYIVNKSKKEKINQNIFNNYLISIASDEEGFLQKHYSKKPKKYRCQSNDNYEREMFKIDNLNFKITDPIKLGSDNLIKSRERYYKHYYHLEPEELDDFTNKMSEHYLRGIKWVTEYYFDKCPSWNWYYPYDHPPFLHDVVQNIVPFKNFKFELGEPLKPYEQLLCVLPKQSVYLLPKCLHKIMLNLNSSVAHLYPLNFDIDLINKKKYWMGIPILPSLEIDTIKHVFKKYENKLNYQEREMNKISNVLKF